MEEDSAEFSQELERTCVSLSPHFFCFVACFTNVFGVRGLGSLYVFGLHGFVLVFYRGFEVGSSCDGKVNMECW